MGVKDTFYSMTKARLVPDLSFGFQEETIKVRVIRAWDGISYQVPHDLSSHFILLDEEDNQLLGLAPPTERPLFMSKLQEGMIYYITNFKIVFAPPKWNPVAAERAIIFTQRTRIRPCYDGCTIANLKFELCSLQAIASHIGKNSNLIDVSGVLFGVGNIKHNSHAVKNLDIRLIDERNSCFTFTKFVLLHLISTLETQNCCRHRHERYLFSSPCSATVVTISLWGTQAGQFDIQFPLYRKKNLVLAVSGLHIKHHDGHARLTLTPATKIYFNPSYKQLRKLGDIVAATYGAFVCRLPLTEIYENLYPISVQRIYLNLWEMEEPNKWLQPKLFKKQSFFCKVTITDLLSCEEWSFRRMYMDEVPQPVGRVYRCGACNMSFTGIGKRGTLCTFEVEAPTSPHAGSTKELVIKATAESSKLIMKRKAGHCPSSMMEGSAVVPYSFDDLTICHLCTEKPTT